MTPNPLLGVLLLACGGFAAGSFYAPLKKVRGWAWESFWLVMGVAAWLAAPWLAAWLTTPRLGAVLAESPRNALMWCIIFGLLWGVGGLTFGLSVRYLGMGLGFAAALGFCMAFGTLMPPVYDGLAGQGEGWATLSALFTTAGGQIVLGGIAVCLAGIGLCGWASMNREAELTDEQKRGVANEFALGKGFAVAAIAGILSACFAFGLAAGRPIAEVARAMDTPPVFVNNAVLVVILIGGFTTNAVWCLALKVKNGSLVDYWRGPAARQTANYLLSALGGVIWYGQFFFYGMGSTKLGEKYDFSSWSAYMAFIIVFSNLWGIVFHEWRGTSWRTKALVWAGILALIASTVMIGMGNYLAE